MTDEEVSKTLTEKVLDRCYHDPTPINLKRKRIHWRCSKCKEHISIVRGQNLLTPAGFIEIVTAARKEEWWPGYCLHRLSNLNQPYGMTWVSIENYPVFLRELAEWLVGKVKP